MGLKDRVKRAERHLKVNGTRIELEDGSTLTVTEQDFIDRFGSNMERLTAAYAGTPVPPPHPLAVALLEARYLPTRLEKMAEQQRLLELQINGMKQQREETLLHTTERIHHDGVQPTENRLDKHPVRGVFR